MTINIAAAAVLTAALAGSWAAAPQRGSAPSSTPQRRAAPSVEMFKSPTCGCCSKWADHMRQAGFTVHVQDLPDADLEKVKKKWKVPDDTRSCHTARVGAYVLEGHIPASEIKRLLKERPDVAGLVVPGMPIGSPGMEVPGAKPRPYQVLSFDTQGNTKVFSMQRP
jgi:hypothetical protein